MVYIKLILSLLLTGAKSLDKLHRVEDMDVNVLALAMFVNWELKGSLSVARKETTLESKQAKKLAVVRQKNTIVVERGKEVH